MTPTVKLHLVEAEMLRWLADPRVDRDRVHADRVSKILNLEYADTRHAVIGSS